MVPSTAVPCRIETNALALPEKACVCPTVYHVNTDSMQTTLTGKFVSVLMLFLCSSLLQCGARMISAGGKSLGEAGEQRGDEVQGAG